MLGVSYSGFTVCDRNLIFGYIKNELSNDELQSKNLFIEVEKQKYPIEIQPEPLKRTDFKNL